METLLLTIGVFIAFHLIPAIGPVRRRLVASIGLAPYMVGYSMLSLGLLGWVGVAYAEADYVELWVQAPWMRWVLVLVMYPVSVLLVGFFLHANPLSVGFRGASFDPAKPGIVSVTRHPLMWALLLWALAHIVPNGDAASLLMFGLFALLGAMGPVSLDMKARRQLGAERWAALAGPTSSVPFWAALTGRGKIDWGNVLCQPAIGGMILYAALMGAHAYVIGVSPLP
jgi:uncharacterized membrane protein